MAGPYDTIPTFGQQAITNLIRGVRHDVTVYFHAGGDFWTPTLEAAIQSGWVPSGGAWTNVTNLIVPNTTIKIAADNTITFQVTGHGTANWPDDSVIVIVARHWDGGGWSAYYVAGWGFVRGDGRQDDQRFTQTGEITCTYVDRFKKMPLSSHRFGRRNLCIGATIAGSSPAIANPNTEAPLEYVSQANAAGENAIDGNVDTVYIADVVCDPARPVLGDSVVPRFLRMYAGRNVRTIGAGGEPIWIEIWCGHNVTPWGITWTGIPNMYNDGAGEGQPAERTDARLSTAAVTYGDGSRGFQVRSFQNAAYTADTWIQWIIGSGYVKRPIRVSVDIKAASTPSIGKALLLSITDAAPTPSARRDFDPLILAQEWAHYEFPFDSSGNYGGAKISIKTLPGELISGDIYYELRNLRVDIGWDNDMYGQENGFRTLWLGVDDGIGHEKWIKVAWNLEKSGNWRIPPYSSIIITDDIGVFKGKFDPGDRQVYQLKNTFPTWFIGPSPEHTRLRLVLMNNPPDLFDIDNLPGDAIDLDTFSFDTFGWTPHQGVLRANPLGTGAITTEEFPQPGMEQTFGTAFIRVDLGAFVAPTLIRDISATDLYIPVDDLDRYPWFGTIRIGMEDIQFNGKDAEYLIGTFRGVNATTQTAHNRGDAVTPCFDANAGAGATAQTGPMVDKFTIRRRDGKPVIASGALLWSNLPGPGDPSVGGAKWERHPDWNLAMRWAGNQSATIDYTPPLATVRGGVANVIQARHWCGVGDRMGYVFGQPQRFKVNELIAREYSPGAAQDGAYLGHQAGDYGGVIGHILTQHAGVPLTKFANLVASGTPITDLHIAPTTVQSALNSVMGAQYLTVYNDRWNNLYMIAVPGSSLFLANTITWTWTDQNAWGARIVGQWGEAHPCAQVILWALEPAALKQYYFAYPAVPDRLGNTIELHDVAVGSYDQGREMARAIYRNARARRSIQLNAGACPWIGRYQRHIVNLPSLDTTGAWSGVNCYVRDYTVEIGMGDGGITWQTSVTLTELAL